MRAEKKQLASQAKNMYEKTASGNRKLLVFQPLRFAYFAQVSKLAANIEKTQKNASR